MKTTRRALRGWYTALLELGNRFAPTITSDIKISRLLRPVSEEWEKLSLERTKIATRLIKGAMEARQVTALEELPQSVQRLINGEIAEMQADWDKEEVEITLPEQRITQNDLPKERTGEDGWKNGTGLGAIISELGDLFEYPKD